MSSSLLARKWLTVLIAIALLVVVLLVTNARAADPNLSVGNWTSYDHTNSSLPNPENVTALSASPVAGRLWVGTSNAGLFVFDGLTWTNYTTANTGGGLPSNTINAVASFTDNAAWVATNAGVAYFNGSSWTAYTTSNTGSGTCVGLPSNNVRGIAVVGGAYEAWFATDAGAAHYSSFAWTKFNASASCGSLPSQDMYQVAVDPNNANTVWFAAGAYALRYNGSTWSSWTTATVGQSGDLLYSVIVDHFGHPWVTGYAFEIPATGVSMYDGSTWTNYYSQSTRLQNALEIYSLAEDNDGRIWIGADDGVITYDRGAWCEYYRSGSNVIDCLGHQWSAGVFSSTVRSLAVSNDRVWMGINYTGIGGVSGFDLKWHSTSAKFSPVYAACEFNTILHRSGEIWAGCYSSGIDRITSFGSGYEQNTGYSIENGQSDSDNINALLELPSHDLLAASADHGVLKLTYPGNIRFTTVLSAGNILPSNNTTALALDWNNRLWIGTTNNGLVISGTNSTFTMTTANSPLPTNSIFALKGDNAHRMWIGTYQGLVVYDGITMTRITTPTISGNNVYAIAQGSDNRVWVGTTTGLNVFDGTSWSQYTTSHGLLSNDVRSLAFAADGTLLVSEWDTGVQHLDVAGGRFNSINFYNPLNSGLQEASDAAYHDPNRREIIAMVGDGTPQEGWWFGHYWGGLSMRADITTPIGITPPTLISFTPTSAAAGQYITVTGTNFDQYGTQILFSGSSPGLPYVPGYTSLSTSTSAMVEVPNGAARGPLRAVVHGVSSVNSAGIFTPLPRIDYFNPTYGGWGSVVTVSGKNLYPVLSSVVTVTMSRSGGGTVSTTANRLTTNQFRFVVPRLAATGLLTISVDGNLAASPSPFYVAQTTISRLELNQGVPQYPLVAGKSTMLIAYANITGTRNQADAISSVIVTVTTPTGAVEVFHGIHPPLLVNSSQVITADTYRPRALIPGSALIEEGSYRFEMGLYYGSTYVASATTTADLHATNSLGLAGLYMGAGRVELINTDYYRNLNIALANLARMYPVADGIATNNSFPPPGTGVRYFDDGDMPIPCVPSAVAGCYNPTDFLQGLATGSWLAAAHLTHNTAPLNILNPNAQVNSMAAFYLQSYLNPSTPHPAWGFPILGILVTPIEPGNGTLYSGYTLGQEVGHTFYQVLAGSPNCCDFDGSVSLLGYGWIGHSIHFSASDSHRAYNTLNEALIPDRNYNGVSDISYAGAHGVLQYNDNTLIEPYEYQWLYDDRRGVFHLPLGLAQQQTPTLMLSANPASTPINYNIPAPRAVSIAPTLTAWSSVGYIRTADDALTLFTSQQVTATHDMLTYLPAASPYHITYYSGTVPLWSEPLTVFTSTHGITVSGYVFFAIVRPVPAGTDHIRIASDVNTMLVLTHTAHAPSVTVNTPIAGAVFTSLQSITVTWSAADLDGDPMTYYLYDSADGGLTFNPIGIPVTTTSAVINAATLVSGTHRLKIVASDGWNTGEGTSQTFSVQNHPPVAAIVTPSNGSQFDQIDTIHFSTLSTDREDGVLTGQKGGGLMTWYAEPGHIYLGNATTIDYGQLPPGYYTVTLTVFDNQGLSSTDSITLTVLADFDGDGLPDAYENAHPCLHAWDPTDASLDSDHDGLSNLDEYALGTDPCTADTDGDGHTDGEEFNNGSDPLNPGDTPQPPVTAVAPANITITMPSNGGLPVAPELVGISNNGGGNLTWNAVGDVPWLSFGPYSDTHAEDVVTVTVNTSSVANGSTGHLIFYSNGTAGTNKLVVNVYVSRPPRQVYLPLILRNH